MCLGFVFYIYSWIIPGGYVVTNPPAKISRWISDDIPPGYSPLGGGGGS